MGEKGLLRKRKTQFIRIAPYCTLDAHLRQCAKRDLIELVKDLRMEIKKMKKDLRMERKNGKKKIKDNNNKV